MGMYTEIFVNVDLKPDTPDEVINTIQAICEKGFESPPLKDKPARWFVLFNNGSYYTPATECGLLTYDDISQNWSLLGKGDIKNYASEIEQFFDFIMPWVDAHDGEFIGYHRYEESLTPTLVYKQGETK